MTIETKFTKEETELVAGYFNNIKISPMAPDAVGLCQQMQSIVSKMTLLTEDESSESLPDKRRPKSKQ